MQAWVDRRHSNGALGADGMQRMVGMGTPEAEPGRCRVPSPPGRSPGSTCLELTDSARLQVIA